MKKIVIINIFILLVLFTIGIYFYTTNIPENSIEKKELANEILFEPYKLENNELTLLIIFSDEDGIKSIQDIKNGKTLNCYGKTAASIDYKIAYDKDEIYSFIIEKINGEKIQKDLIIDKNFRDSIIATNINFEEDNNYFDIEIEQEENNKYYYKYSEDDNWKEYAGKFVQTSYAINSMYDISDYGIVDIYFKKIYNNKDYNEIIIKKEIKLESLPELVTEINNIDDLKKFSYQVNSGAKYKDKEINLNLDIDLSNVCYEVDGTIENDISWIPIGSNIKRTDDIIKDYEEYFAGKFNGNGNEIIGLYINNNKDVQGLFGYIDNGGSINNLIVSGKINANNNVGGICGYIKDGTVLNCKNKVNITATGNNVGGLIGRIDRINKEVIKYSCNEGNITSSGSYVGGIIRKFWCK